MSDKPEALRLADALEQGKFLLSVERDATAAELRRLHAETEEWRTKAAAWLASPEAAQRLEGYRELGRLAERNELLEALTRYVDHFGDPLKCARAAIAKATGEAT